MIPPEGWLVSAKVAPGGTCIIDVYRYSFGTLHIDNIVDTYIRDGRIRATFSLAGYDNLTLAYRSYELEPIQDLTEAGVVLPSTISAQELQNGRLLTEIQRGHDRELIGEAAASVDIRRAFGQEMVEQYNPRSQAPILATRVTDDQQELLAILGDIGFAAGMSGPDRNQLIAAASLYLGP